MEFDFEKEIEINLDSLELDCQDQSKLLGKYMTEKARLKQWIRNLKEEYKVQASQVKKDLLETEKKKPTVAEMDIAVTLDADCQTLIDQINQKEYEADLVDAAIASINDRKYMLQEEVKLLGMNYFSRVSTTNGNRVIAKEAAKTSEKSKKAVNRKRKRNRE